jgi:hypothetical protein
MADASSNIDVFEDDYIGRDYRSTLHTVTKSTINVPGNPTVETVGSEQVNGAMRIGAEAGSGSWINVDYLTLGSVLKAKAWTFWGRFKIAAFSASENEMVRFGMRESSTNNGLMLIEARYNQTNYRIITRPNSGGSEIAYDTMVAVPTSGASSGWMDISFTLDNSTASVRWELAADHVVQASGTVPNSQVPTNGINLTCRAEKLGAGTRLTQLYTDVWKVVQNA